MTSPVQRTDHDGAPTCPEGGNPADFISPSRVETAQGFQSWITRVSPQDLFEGKHIVREGRGSPLWESETWKVVKLIPSESMVRTPVEGQAGY